MEGGTPHALDACRGWLRPAPALIVAGLEIVVHRDPIPWRDRRLVAVHVRLDVGHGFRELDREPTHFVRLDSVARKHPRPGLDLVHFPDLLRAAVLAAWHLAAV